jgi:PAS domain S-box-containing protein
MTLPSPGPRKRSYIKYVAALLTLGTLIGAGGLTELDKLLRGVVQRRAMFSAIEGVAAAVEDAETLQRTFLITGDENDRRAFLSGADRIGKKLDALAAVASPNEVQKVRVASLRPYVLERRAELERVAELRRGGGLNPTLSEIGANHEPHGMGEYRRLMGELKQVEDERLNSALVVGHKLIGRTMLTLLCILVLALVSLSLLSRSARRAVAGAERSKDAAREPEEWLTATLSSLSDGVIATDGRGRVRLMNAAAEALTGWDAREAKGEALEEVFSIISEESREPVVVPLKKVLTEGASLGLTNHTLLLSRDGSERPIEHAGAPIRVNGGAINGVVLCFRDVTERRWAELELKHSKESADAANRAKDQFLAVLSHELRTPLTPVMVAVSAMIEAGASNELRADLEMIRRNLELESRLIDDLLDLSRIARGGLRLQLEIEDVHQAIRRALEMCRDALQKAGLLVREDLAALMHHVRADEMRIMQVFWNLTSNAAKYTPRGGTLEIRTRNENQGEDGYIVIEFRDNGIGLDPELLPRIFDPFEQGDRKSRSRYGGLGLGLAISKNVVEAHGGTMSARSPGPGRGSTFRVELPVAPVPARKAVTPLAPPSLQKHRGFKILLVEDNKDILRYLAFVLDHRGHRVLTADSLSAAREIASTETIDLLLSDVELPDGSGLELMRELAAERAVKGIAISGFGTEQDLQLSEEAGFHAHLLKPIDMQQLEEAIRTVTSCSEFSRP